MVQTRPWLPEFETILVMEFVKGSRNLFDVFKQLRTNNKELEKLIARLILFMKNIHGDGMVHGDLRANNILVTEDYKMLVIDLLDMRVARPGSKQFIKDVRRVAHSMMRADIPRKYVKGYLEGYADAMGVKPGRYVDWLPEKYPRYQLKAAKRAARNCIKRNHAVQHFKCHGYHVVMIKGEDEQKVRNSIASFLKAEKITGKPEYQALQKKDLLLMAAGECRFCLRY